MTLVEHLTEHEVEIPRTAMKFAEDAVRAGWIVRVTTVRGPKMTAEGEQVREVTLQAQSEEQGGGNKQVRGDVKVIESVAVRCRRGRDYVVAIWEDGSFDSAWLPWRLRTLSSAEATKHVRSKL